MKDFKHRLDRFMEQQGFYWLCGICALVILLTALWTFNQPEAPTPQPPTLAVQHSQAESLSQARKTPYLSTPTPGPLVFHRPVAGTVKRPFSASAPVFFEHTGHWQLHAAVDYAAPRGTPVKAAAEGTVLSCSGQTVVITHPQGYESRYDGLISAVYVAAGDPVAAGQTIGHVGTGPLWEQAEEAHLHFEITHQGRSIDPAELIKE